MATSYSTNLALTLQGTGDNPGTWGNITNTNLGTLIEQAISGYEVQALTSGTTLTLAITNGASSVARNMYLEFTGNGSTVIVPSNKKLYFVYNNCSSGTITVKVAGQTGIDVPKGAKQILVSNGTDIEEAISGLNGTTGVSNTLLGTGAGTSITSGLLNTLVGVNAGTSVSTGVSNTAIGYDAGGGSYNVSFATYVGYQAGRNVQSNNNTAVGNAALQGVGSSATGGNNTAFGFWALREIAGGASNTAVGNVAGDSISTGAFNTLVGSGAGTNITSGGSNTFLGYFSGNGVTTNGTNVAVGDFSYGSGNYSNSICLGYNSTVSGSDQGKIGDGNVDVYAKSFTNTSDARDKADIQDTNLGLNFIMQLQPRMYRWDMREFYCSEKPAEDAPKEEWAAWREANKLANLTHDGTRKRNRLHQGLIAQEVKAVIDGMGVDFGGFRDSEVNGGDAQMGLEYIQFITPLIKAIQELKAEFDEYKRTHP